MKRIIVIAAALVAVIIVVAVGFKSGKTVSPPLEQEGTSASRIVEAVPSKGVADPSERSGQETASPLVGQPEPESEEEPLTEEEKLVNDFDDLTDKWQEPSKSGVTLADVDNFGKAFRKIPKARQDECVHRALNLIPDENVMLLAGILMDKSMDKEIVETVYNDILNRDEDVKKPILQQIFKDKTHPCWADTAWILDVTDELPKAK